MEIREIRMMSGLSRAEFSRRYEIPVRTLENWEAGVRKCPEYVEKLLDRCVRMDFADEDEYSECRRKKDE